MCIRANSETKPQGSVGPGYDGNKIKAVDSFESVQHHLHASYFSNPFVTIDSRGGIHSQIELCRIVNCNEF